jgi:diaminopimelate epimerase
MITTFPFDKLSCGGNDFILFDERSESIPSDRAELTRKICHRTRGVGADGTIFLENDEETPFYMRLYNADGSSAEVSYNGSRCLALYASKHRIARGNFKFNSQAGQISVSVQGKMVTLAVPDPEILDGDMILQAPWGENKGTATNAGVPYLVVPVQELDHPELPTWARTLKVHSFFGNGTNVAVVKEGDSELVNARFFERGVEEETMSSGTGVVAIALYAATRYGISSEVVVTSTGGNFPVHFSRSGDSISNVETAAEVTYICRGDYSLEF